MNIEILIGRQDTNGDGTRRFIPETTTSSLIIDGEIIRVKKMFDGGSEEDKRMLSEVEKFAKEYAKLIKEKGAISPEYNLINGQRIRFTTHEKVFCQELPSYALDVFNETFKEYFSAPD